MDRLFQLDAECEQAGLVYCEDKENYDIADDNYKIKLAQIESLQSGNSGAEKKRQALISSDWNDYVAMYQDFRRAMRQSRDKKETLQRHWDTCQSLLSAEKALLMKLGGGEL